MLEEVDRYNQNIEYFKNNWIDIFKYFTPFLKDDYVPQFDIKYDENDQSYSIIKLPSHTIVKSISIDNLSYNQNSYFKVIKSYPEIEDGSYISSKLKDFDKLELKIEEKGNINNPRNIIVVGALDINAIKLYIDDSYIDSIMIYEPNIEILYLSMKVLDYYKNNKLYFITSPNDFQKISSSYVNILKDSLYSIYLHGTIKVYDNMFFTDIIPILSGVLHVRFVDAMTAQKNIALNLQRNIEYLALYNQITTTLPLLVIGSGPSLGEYIDFIKQYNDSFIICCAGSALRRLYNEGIKVDIVFSLDPKEVVKYQFEDVPKEYLKDTILIASEFSDSSIFGNFGYEYITEHEPHETVIHFGLDTILKLGFKLIFTLGNDSCYSDDKKVRAKDTLTEIQAKFFNLDNPNIEYLEVRGNFKKIVYVDHIFIRFIYAYESIFKKHKDITMYNLSNGAYIEGFTPLLANSIPYDLIPSIEIPKKQKLMQNISNSSFQKTYIPNINSLISSNKQVLKLFKKLKLSKIDKYQTFKSYQKFKYTFINKMLDKHKLASSFKNMIFIFSYEMDILIAQKVDFDNINFDNIKNQIHKNWLDIFEELLLEVKNILKIKKSFTVEDKFMDEHLNLVNKSLSIDDFSYTNTKLTEEQKDYLYIHRQIILKSKTISIDKKEFVKLYIDSYYFGFEKALQEYLTEFKDIEDLINRLEWIYKISLIDGFDFNTNDNNLIINLFSQILEPTVFNILSVDIQNTIIKLKKMFDI